MFLNPTTTVLFQAQIKLLFELFEINMHET